MTDTGRDIDTPLPETAHGHEMPYVRQFSLFLENRIGVLRHVLGGFKGLNSRMVAINILETSDSAIIRCVFDHSDVGREVIDRNGWHYLEHELLVVLMPPSSEGGLISICTALFAAEVNIMYAYPLLVRPMGRQAIAMRVDEMDQAADVLTMRGFGLLDEWGLRHGGGGDDD